MNRLYPALGRNENPVFLTIVSRNESNVIDLSNVIEYNLNENLKR